METTDSLDEAHRDTILLLDDEKDILDSLEVLLLATLHDVQVARATTAQQALDRLHEGGIDLIVSDYKLAGMDGVEFLQEARRVAPNVPRILMTAFADLQLAMHAINEARIEHFFTKPLEAEKVIEVVWQTLDDHRARVQRDEAARHSLQSLRDHADPAHSSDESR